MVSFSVPPGYRREQPATRPRLDAFVGVIDAILQEDKARPAKQRHTAKRVFDRLREEHQFTGGYTIVKDYLRSAAQRSREMFIPLVHPAGEAQADFGEALAVIGGVERKAHYLVVDLPHSDDCFVMAFPAETTEAFLEGHIRAFAYFGGVPTRILYDNTKIAVAKILGGTERKRTRAFSELQSHYLFADKFGRPAKGNDKGKVEGLVGYARRNFMVPIPRFASWDAFNAHLEAACRKRRQRKLRGHTETIAERFERDRAAFLTLPAAPYDACEKVPARVSSLALVRYRGNDYSVPTRHGHLQVLVRATFMRSPSPAAARSSQSIRAAMSAKPWSTIRCTTSPPTRSERESGGSGASSRTRFSIGLRNVHRSKSGPRRVAQTQSSVLLPGDLHEPNSRRKSIEAEAQNRPRRLGFPLVRRKQRGT
jgi:transposase